MLYDSYNGIKCYIEIKCLPGTTPAKAVHKQTANTNSKCIIFDTGILLCRNLNNKQIITFDESRNAVEISLTACSYIYQSFTCQGYFNAVLILTFRTFI